MGTIRGWVVLLAIFLCACAGPGARPAPAPSAPVPAGPGGLPALAGLAGLDAGLPRLTSAAYNFAAGDLLEAQYSAFDGTTLHLDREPFSFAILGANVGTQLPTQLSLSGTCDGLWVAISDYQRGTWRWIGEDLGAAGTLNIGSGQWTADGMLYFAVVCPAGAEASLQLELSLVPAGSGVWNFMVWFAGDNNLADAAFADLQELEAVGSTAAINILAGFDIDGGLVGDVSGVDQVRFIKVVPDSDPAAVKVDGDPANVSFPRAGYDSSDPAHLVEFVDWAAANFTADHTALVLWDHGSGWRIYSDDPLPPGGARRAAEAGRQATGVLGDDSHGPAGGILTANSAVAAALAGKHFDLLLFDACNMAQVEALYEYRDLADWLVASEVLVPNDGYPYDDALDAWLAAYPLAPQDVGQAFVDANTAFYTASGEYATHAVISSTKLTTLAGALSDLAAAVTPNAEVERAAFQEALNAAFEPDAGDGERDLLDFLQTYQGLTANMELQADLAAASSAVQDALYCFGQYDQPAATGLAAWLPSTWYFEQALQDEYDELAFDDATGWLAMLQAIGATAPGGGVYTTRWAAGDRFILTWDDPADPDLMIDTELTGPSYQMGGPGYPDEFAGMVEFSPDSMESGLCEEWGQLLATAPPGAYRLAFYYDGGPTDPASIVIHLALQDETEALKEDLGDLTLLSGEYLECVIFYYNDGTVPEAAWVPGDKVELTWDTAAADVDLDITAPDGRLAGPYWPAALSGVIEFSLDSADSGEPVEWGKLLSSGPEGLYLINAYLGLIDGPPLPSLTIAVKLYDSSGTLKQDLGAIHPDPALDQDTAFAAAVLTYTAP